MTSRVNITRHNSRHVRGVVRLLVGTGPRSLSTLSSGRGPCSARSSGGTTCPRVSGPALAPVYVCDHFYINRTLWTFYSWC